MINVLGHAEVQRRVGIGGRDQVPARRATAQMVKRGESLRDEIELLEGGQGGRDQTQALGHVKVF